jgi:hypothetical protein
MDTEKRDPLCGLFNLAPDRAWVFAVPAVDARR